jgi:hypothetical protein
MRHVAVIGCVLVAALADCSSGNAHDTSPYPPYTGSCPGTANVDAGLFAGGSPGVAVAASRFGPLGTRVLLATTVGDGCWAEAELEGVAAGGSLASVVRLTLAAGLTPGTYPIFADAGSPVWATYAFATPGYGGFLSSAVSGSLTIESIDPSQGVQATYHVDFGLSPVAGGGGTLPDGGMVSFGALGELIEDGTFDAPPCELCPSAPPCDGGCPPAGAICNGAPCCENCVLDSEPICGVPSSGPPGGLFGLFDGFSFPSEIVP